MMYTTIDWIVMGGIYLFVLVAYLLGTWVQTRATNAVAKMDEEDAAKQNGKQA